MRRTLFALIASGLIGAALAGGGSGGRACPDRLGRPGSSDRDDLPRERPRVGPRGRHEPVRRARLRERGLDARADSRPLLRGHDARPGAGRAGAGAARGGAAGADRLLQGAVSDPRRLRQDPRASGRVARARAGARGGAERRSDPVRRSSRLPPGKLAARAWPPRLPRPARGRRLGEEADRDQRRRAGGLPRRRRSARDAGSLARRSAEGPGRRRALVRARTPAGGKAVRPLRGCSKPGLRGDRGRGSAGDSGDQGNGGPGAPVRRQAGRRALPLHLRRAHGVGGRGVRNRCSVPPGRRTIRTARSLPSTAGGRRR